MINLARIREEQAKKQLEVRIDLAAKKNYARLRFDGAYRTTTPVELEAASAEWMTLQCRFQRDLTVNYSCQHGQYEDGEVADVDDYTDSGEYQVLDESTIRFRFDTGTWVYEWEGCPIGDTLELTFRMEELLGISSGPKCVVEGEATLLFVAE